MQFILPQTWKCQQRLFLNTRSSRLNQSGWTRSRRSESVGITTWISPSLLHFSYKLKTHLHIICNRFYQQLQSSFFTNFLLFNLLSCKKAALKNLMKLTPAFMHAFFCIFEEITLVTYHIGTNLISSKMQLNAENA